MATGQADLPQRSSPLTRPALGCAGGLWEDTPAQAAAPGPLCLGWLLGARDATRIRVTYPMRPAMLIKSSKCILIRLGSCFHAISKY